MDYKKLIQKIKNQQDLDVQGFSDLEKLGEYIEKLEKENKELNEACNSIEW